MHPDQGMPGKEPTMLIIGCDYHPRFQKIAMLDTATGEIKVNRLEHENGESKKFYASLPKGVLVGIEATGSTQWFERMVSECGHELWVGDPAEIRARRVRKQKTDERDALHLLDLLMTNRFPRVWVPSPENRDARQLLQHRQKLVGMRTSVKNQLHGLAMGQGLCRKQKLWSEPELALEMLRQALRESVPPAPVLGDSAYGNNAEFRAGVRDLAMEV